MHYDAIYIGGGAAGLFAAITCADQSSNASILVLEQSYQVMSKIKISGGGRCNLTNACFDPKELVKNYPRGNKELLSAFHHFQPSDTMTWFEEHNVALKTEEDGRVFPASNTSQTIFDAIITATRNSRIEIRYNANITKVSKTNNGFSVTLAASEEVNATTIMLATGGSRDGHRLAMNLGHTIVKPVPSLFTFNVPNSSIRDLAGISVQSARVTLPDLRLDQSGPLLITHWGFSGPAVIKLSAWAARKLSDLKYQTTCHIDWIPQLHEERVRIAINDQRQNISKRAIIHYPLFPSIPKQLWKALVSLSGINDTTRWQNLSKSNSGQLLQRIKHDRYTIDGKTTYKQEFVTCGGITLSEVDFKRMESRLVPGLFFGGEILNIDGITGGFNFQAAWTSGWLAGTAIANSINKTA